MSEVVAGARAVLARAQAGKGELQVEVSCIQGSGEPVGLDHELVGFVDTELAGSAQQAEVAKQRRVLAEGPKILQKIFARVRN